MMSVIMVECHPDSDRLVALKLPLFQVFPVNSLVLKDERKLDEGGKTEVVLLSRRELGDIIKKLFELAKIILKRSCSSGVRLSKHLYRSVITVPTKRARCFDFAQHDVTH